MIFIPVAVETFHSEPQNDYLMVVPEIIQSHQSHLIKH